MKQPNTSDERLRVLIVDDDHDTLGAMTKLIRASGHDAESAASYRDAMHVVSASPPFHVVLCDLGLPDRSGYELLRELQSRCRIAGIAVSGFSSPKDVDASIAAGFREHLVKPVSIDDVLAAIRRCRAGPPASSP